MRLGTYNVENLFMRARALNLATWAEGKGVLERFAALNSVLNKARYTRSDKTRIVRLLDELGLGAADDGGSFVVLRQTRGNLLRRRRDGVTEIVANGRGDWIGWVDLKNEPVDEVAMRCTARVVHDVAADVLCVVEAESRPALVHFSEQLLPAVSATPFAHAMLIDGNDARGIDVGLFLRRGFEITRIQSHIDDEDEQGRIFARDCAEYWIRTERGTELVLLLNHFKSKGYGGQAESNARRLRQARQVAKIYASLTARGVKNIAVLGDLNDTPNSAPLAPLLRETNLRDVSAHSSFEDGGRPGTYANGSASQKIDYVLLSPSLFGKMTSGGVFRMGVWGGKNGTLFPHYPEMTKASEAASDHAAVWADLDV